MIPRNVPVGGRLNVSIDERQLELFRLRSNVWELRVGSGKAFPRILQATTSAWLVKHPHRPMRQFTDFEQSVVYAAQGVEATEPAEELANA